MTSRKASHFRWLHVSDLHLRSDVSFARNETIEQLFRYLERERTNKPFDAVFFTGDLAYFGRQEDYGLAHEFLHRLCTAAGTVPERLFAVPGNHDAEHARIGSHNRPRLQNQDDVDELFSNARALRLMGERFQAFNELALHYPGMWRFGPKPYSVTTLRMGGARIVVLALNTAWCVTGRKGDDIDKGVLSIGRPILKAGLDEADRERPHLTFVLMHHPIDWLLPFEREEVRNLLARTGAIVLHGHLHKSDYLSLGNEDGTARYVQAGALYQESTYPKRFVLGSWDPALAKAQLRSHVILSNDTSAAWQQEKSWDQAIGQKVPKQLCHDSAALEMNVAYGVSPEREGNVCERVVCAFLDGSPTAIDQVVRVDYTYESDTCGTYRHRNDQRGEHFVQTFPMSSDARLRAVVSFSDCCQVQLTLPDADGWQL